MEVFTGDHTDVVLFSDTHFSPYSLPTSDSFSDHHKISISTDHFQPPQKLRPIRCSNNNVRSFSDRCGSDDPVDAKPLSWHPEAGVYNGEINTCSNLGLPVAECQIEAAISPCSSDETIKLQNQPIKEPINKKKRKRKSRKKMEFYFERMVQTVMEKQEQMHKQLIDMLEQNEKESIIREQAWKKHETERAKRDEQARKQQVSQCQALLSFIQKTLGQEIQIANHPDTNLESQEKSKYDDDDILMKNIEESEGDPNGRRWPKSEVQALITVRVALNHMFENGKGPKGSIWDEVAASLSGMGYYRTPKKCKEKWENINKYYRRTMEKGKATSKSCSYFKELEMLHKNGFSSAISHDEDQSNEGFVSAISHDEDQRNAVMIVPNGEGEGNK
ncbi:trihelix transcription factor GT-2-like [Bidens hawaiensis]|uniref:trihelix transcription factor GT-2-like n=1 Tax=Bidens hawaiensis TaxID=980011 RepID=UPI004048F1AE